MTQLDKLRSMEIEEVARDRLQYVKAGPLGFIKGDFGYNIYFGSFEKYNHKQAYAEALRLEMAWLLSDVPMPVAEGMCCDCIRPNRHSICGDYSENSECKYRLEDGSCWAGKEAEGRNE